jgi:hypothetical protein
VLKDFDPSELRLIVLHELAHLKRHDILGNWAITLACMLHWFNPLVWALAWRMRADRELACDELVLACSNGRDAHAYGCTLVKLIEHLSSRAVPRQLVGIIESTGPMQRRVRMIARFNPTASKGWVWALCLLTVLGCTTMTDAVRGDDKPAGGTSRLAASVTGAAAPVVDAADRDASPATAAELQAKLHRVIPEIRFENVGFSDAIDFLRDHSQANLVVEWKALEAAGIDKAAAVSMNLRRVTFEQALEHLLKDVGGAAVRLDYMIDQGAIIVSTDESLASRSETVFYDVSDLMRDPEGMALGGQPLKEKMESLVRIIQDFVAPDSWKENGGSVGSIGEFNGKLIVTTTPKNQQRIVWLLDKLREHPTSAPAMAGK